MTEAATSAATAPRKRRAARSPLCSSLKTGLRHFHTREKPGNVLHAPPRATKGGHGGLSSRTDRSRVRRRRRRLRRLGVGRLIERFDHHECPRRRTARALLPRLLRGRLGLEADHAMRRADEGLLSPELALEPCALLLERLRFSRRVRLTARRERLARTDEALERTGFEVVIARERATESLGGPGRRPCAAQDFEDRRREPPCFGARLDRKSVV